MCCAAFRAKIRGNTSGWPRSCRCCVTCSRPPDAPRFGSIDSVQISRKRRSSGFRTCARTTRTGDVYAGASAAAVQNLAYFFAADGVAPDTLAGYTRSLIDAVDGWRRAYTTSSLVYLEHGDRVVVVDSRAMLKRTRTVVLDGLTAKVFLLCDAARGSAALAAAVPESSPSEVAGALSFLCEQRLTWFDGTRYLGLCPFRLRDFSSREPRTTSKPRSTSPQRAQRRHLTLDTSSRSHQNVRRFGRLRVEQSWSRRMRWLNLMR